MLGLCRVKEISIQNSCEYINYLTQPVLGSVGVGNKKCFARSKLMDLSDFLICSNALNIRLISYTVSRGPFFVNT